MNPDFNITGDTYSYIWIDENHQTELGEDDVLIETDAPRTLRELRRGGGGGEGGRRLRRWNVSRDSSLHTHFVLFPILTNVTIVTNESFL